jgi:hypothetical protein
VDDDSDRIADLVKALDSVSQESADLLVELAGEGETRKLRDAPVNTGTRSGRGRRKRSPKRPEPVD